MIFPPVAQSMATCKFVHPFGALISGPSQAGKSEFVKKFLDNLACMCDARFDRILVYYGEFQPIYRKFPSDKVKIEFFNRLPERNDYEINSLPKLLIIDDLMLESAKSDVIVNLFTKGCHHKNLSVFFIVQNLFFQGKGLRTISLNCCYIVLFKSPRDKSQVSCIARQICPENPLFLQQAFSDATSIPYGYLLLDLRQETPENFRFRSCIFPEDKFHFVYVPSSSSLSFSSSKNSR